MVERLIQLCIFISLLLPMTHANALNFNASVDTHKLQAGNSLVLTLKADEQAFNKQPNFTPLKQDFEILQNQQSSQVRLINGQISSETQWELTLLPKTEGYVVIPPITYGNTSTKPITINVTKPSKSSARKTTQLIFLDASTDKTEVYVQEQAVFFLRVYQRAQLANASLSKPEIENTVIESLGEPRTYTTKHQGQAYSVTEYRFAIYPQKSGELIIPESVLTGSIASNSRRFSFDPFGNAGKPIRRKSQEIRLSVKAIPASYPKNVPWLPANSLTLAEGWSPASPTFSIGEPATRTVSLKATGVASSLLPPLPQPEGNDIKVYPDQPTYHSTPGPDGIQSERVESYAVIPTKSGRVNLPAIRVHWWNTKTDALEIAELKSKNIQVAGEQRSHQTDAAISAPPPTISETDVAPPSVSNTPSTNPTWIWIAVGATVLWLITGIALIWALKRNKPSTITEAVEPSSPFSTQKLKESHQQFVKACKAKEPRRTEKNLSLWASQLLHDRSIRSSAAILQHVDSELLTKAIIELQAVLYRGKSLDEWDNQLLLDASGDIEKSAQKSKNTSALVDLHPSVP